MLVQVTVVCWHGQNYDGSGLSSVASWSQEEHISPTQRTLVGGAIAILLTLYCNADNTIT